MLLLRASLQGSFVTCPLRPDCYTRDITVIKSQRLLKKKVFFSSTGLLQSKKILLVSQNKTTRTREAVAVKRVRVRRVSAARSGQGRNQGALVCLGSPALSLSLYRGSQGVLCIQDTSLQCKRSGNSSQIKVPSTDTVLRKAVRKTRQLPAINVLPQSLKSVRHRHQTYGT